MCSYRIVHVYNICGSISDKSEQLSRGMIFGVQSICACGCAASLVRPNGHSGNGPLVQCREVVSISEVMT